MSLLSSSVGALSSPCTRRDRRGAEFRKFKMPYACKQTATTAAASNVSRAFKENRALSAANNTPISINQLERLRRPPCGESAGLLAGSRCTAPCIRAHAVALCVMTHTMQCRSHARKEKKNFWARRRFTRVLACYVASRAQQLVAVGFLNRTWCGHAR